jgi:hypothetical protein
MKLCVSYLKNKYHLFFQCSAFTHVAEVVMVVLHSVFEAEGRPT